MAPSEKVEVIEEASIGVDSGQYDDNSTKSLPLKRIVRTHWAPQQYL